MSTLVWRRRSARRPTFWIVWCCCLQGLVPPRRLSFQRPRLRQDLLPLTSRLAALPGPRRLIPRRRFQHSWAPYIRIRRRGIILWSLAAPPQATPSWALHAGFSGFPHKPLWRSHVAWLRLACVSRRSPHSAPPGPPDLAGVGEVRQTGGVALSKVLLGVRSRVASSESVVAEVASHCIPSRFRSL